MPPRPSLVEDQIFPLDTAQHLNDLVQAWPERAKLKPSFRLHRVASLFGKKKLEALAAEITTEEIQDKLEIVKQWHQDYHRGSLKADKETSREQQYNQDFFMKILGYKEKPASPYSFEPKATTLKKQLPDAVISFTDTASEIENISAVVELKGASIDLDKPQRREGNMSPVQQAFKYKTQYRSCPFVIVSNFYEFRLYNDHQLDFEVWTLDDLVNPAYDYRKFKTFYALLRRDRLTVSVGKSPTELLLSEFRVEQDAIGKEFYAKYKQARVELLRDIYRRNEDLRTNFDLAIQKGQKLIDRLVFAFFAEDKGLLPENILLGVQKDAATSSVASLWDMLKTLFAAIDSGSEKLGIPVGYNGGLFAYDAVLNGFSIGDDALKNILALGGYDFDEDLSVNILGHIFEQSISDLEEIRRKIDDKNIPDALDDLSAKSNKRKSDGVFYTPDYIVRYIVDTTLGKYLRSIEENLMVKYQLASKRKDETYEAAEADMYTEYQLALQTVHVIDPACGSGAFLVYALDYLIAENKRVAAILESNAAADTFTMNVFSDESIIDLILRQNLFGVDINDESVEITKLSLWLKTARPGQKLTALDANIKCGNSLINDALIDPKKTFSYRQQFQKPFEGGGFNVVVGNPPYVSALEMSRSMPPEQRKYLKKHYTTSVGAVDLYIYFFELGIKLLRPGGALGFITPNRYLSASYGAKLREWLISNVHFRTLIDYSDKAVFEDASTYPVITILDNVEPKPDEVYQVEGGKIDEETRQPVVTHYSSEMLTKLSENILGFLLNDGFDVASKVFDKGVALETAGTINATSTAGEAEEYAKHINTDGAGLKMINTGTIDPYVSMWGVKRFKDKSGEFMQPYLDIHHSDVSDARRKLYKSAKIIIAKIGLTLEGYYDANGQYASTNTNCMHSFTKDFPAEYVQAWLSSALYNYVFETLFDGLRMAGGYLLYSSPNLRNTPILKADEDDRNEIVGWAKTVIQKRQEQAAAEDKFKRFVLNEAGLTTWPRKLSRWWEMDFFDFEKGLKFTGTLKEKESLSEYFEEYKATVSDHVLHVDSAARKIDKCFYRLGELTDPEIAKVETARVAW